MKKILVGMMFVALILIAAWPLVAQEQVDEEKGPTPVEPAAAPCDFEGKSFCVSWMGDVYYDPSNERDAPFWEKCRVNAEQGNELPFCDGKGLVRPPVPLY
jgi:hypothetical protein